MVLYAGMDTRCQITHKSNLRKIVKPVAKIIVLADVNGL